ncbi:L,D-transpeptidase family protein, partial [Psychrobacter sp. 1U2]
MMKIKPLIASMSIAIISASMSLSAVAATDNTRTTPARTADKLPGIAVLASLDVQESRSTSIDNNNTVATPSIKPKTTDSMSDLIDTKQDNRIQSA